jgi:ectoine hydroxylase-related dioxygenase (phytanoyl-CoA dioxygenase family)
MTISDHDKEQFREEGYFLMPQAIPPAGLEELRAVCEHYIAEYDNSEPLPEDEVEPMHGGELKTRVAPDGCRFLANALTEKNARYFLQQRHTENAVLREFISNPLMVEVCLATLGEEVYFHFEGFVVKYPSGAGSADFSWHQDSSYVPKHELPSLTLWCALDPVDEENGTIYVLPFSRAGTRELAPHETLPDTGKVGYFGDDPGIPAVLPAGGIAVFSSLTFHRSGANTSRRARRALVVQYSAEPIMTEDGSKPWHAADPFLKNGRRVDPS